MNVYPYIFNNDDLLSHVACLSGKLNGYTMPDEDIERLVCDLKRC